MLQEQLMALLRRQWRRFALAAANTYEDQHEDNKANKEKDQVHEHAQ